MKKNEYLIIIADDDEDDLLLIHDVFKSLQKEFILHTVNNGKELLEYLDTFNSLDGGSKRAVPGLVFLDINMPILNGIETLKVIRKHHRFSCIPVVMLTTAHDPDTIGACYDTGAVGYLTKSEDISGFTKKIKDTLTYWLETVHHPINV